LTSTPCQGDARLFISVADTGSFTGAPALYDITPSAVSKAVSRLESALGVRLMNPTTRALHLTEESAAFHARCARACQLLAQVGEEAVAGAGEVSGNVKIGVPTLFGTYLVGPRLPSLLGRHPRLRVEVVSTPRLRAARRAPGRMDLPRRRRAAARGSRCGGQLG
jgi:DNA-binding transcriptional LysR family regulator